MHTPTCHIPLIPTIFYIMDLVQDGILKQNEINLGMDVNNLGNLIIIFSLVFKEPKNILNRWMGGGGFVDCGNLGDGFVLNLHSPSASSERGLVMSSKDALMDSPIRVYNIPPLRNLSLNDLKWEISPLKYYMGRILGV